MKQHSPRFVQLVNEVRPYIREIEVCQLKEMLDAGVPFYLVDVREESEYARDHLPGALHLSKGVIERDIEKTIAQLDAPIVLYCGGGYRSALAAYNLQRMGYSRVLSLAGGYRAWCAAGLPLVRTRPGAPEPTAAICPTQ
ncbi:MAG: sulfurtransferase [Gemmataceae bacterium]|mgnify:FL=1